MGPSEASPTIRLDPNGGTRFTRPTLPLRIFPNLWKNEKPLRGKTKAGMNSRIPNG